MGVQISYYPSEIGDNQNPIGKSTEGSAKTNGVFFVAFRGLVDLQNPPTIEFGVCIC